MAKAARGSAVRDMLQHLIVEGFVEGEKIALQYNDLIGSSGMPGESDTERQIRRIQVRTLTRLLADQEIELYITHAGRVRLAELKDSLRSARIREQFDIIWDGRYFDTDLRIALLDARSDHPITLAYLDLNAALKTANDTLGHAAGDVALRAYLQDVAVALGTDGEAYRIGGDEVIAVIRGLSIVGAVEILSKACRLLMSEKLNYQASPLPPLSVAIGVVTVTDHTANANERREGAEREMYRAKEHSRGRTPRPSTIAVDSEEQIRVIDTIAPERLKK
jgi:diguanylate cyclase (GGDEF)-like protein